MRTLKIIFTTALVTVLLVIIGVGFFLLNGGNITVERRDINHTKTVIVDGVVVESTNWDELLGYEFAINIDDGAYIGR